MLRRRLLITLGTLSALLIATAIGVLVSLQSFFRDLDELTTRSSAVISESIELNQRISELELALLQFADAPAQAGGSAAAADGVTQRADAVAGAVD